MKIEERVQALETLAVGLVEAIEGVTKRLAALSEAQAQQVAFYLSIEKEFRGIASALSEGKQIRTAEEWELFAESSLQSGAAVRAGQEAIQAYEVSLLRMAGQARQALEAAKRAN